MLRFGWEAVQCRESRGVQVRLLMTYVSGSNARGFGDVAVIDKVDPMQRCPQ
jgi:hypothetical protein